MAQPDMVIPPASNSISSMLEKDPSLKAPVQDEKLSIVHRSLLDNVKQKEPKELMESSDIMFRPQTPGVHEAKMPKFRRGDVVWDDEKTMKVVVVKAAIGFSNKGNPFYRVADGKTGDSWIQLETRLRKP